MVSDDTPKHWLDIPGWPRSHLWAGHGKRIVVLTDEYETGIAGLGPVWLIVCPHCRLNPFAVPLKDLNRKLRNGVIPSCRCNNGFGRNPLSRNTRAKKFRTDDMTP